MTDRAVVKGHTPKIQILPGHFELDTGGMIKNNQ